MNVAPAPSQAPPRRAPTPPSEAPARAPASPLGRFARLGLGLVLLILALQGVPLETLWGLLRRSLHERPDLLLAALGVQIVAATLHGLKWYRLLRGAGLDLPRTDVLRSYFFGYFLNNIFTGLGELERIRRLAALGCPTTTVTVTVALERWSGIAAVGLLSFGCTAWLARVRPELRPLAALQGLGLLALCALLALALRARSAPGAQGTPVPSGVAWQKGLGDVLASVGGRITQALEVFTHLHRWLPQALGLSLTSAALGLVAHALLALALVPGLASWEFLWTTPLAAAVGQLPVSVNGLGIQETAYRSLFTLTGLDAAQALGLSVLAHGLKLGVGLLGGLWSVLPTGPDQVSKPKRA